jgi:alkylation response protein AidB-like acyl-CoA dehydrogenase
MGQRYAEQVFDAGLVLLAADAFGGARRCVEMSVSYGMLREQFGRKIGSFQGVKHQIADMAVDVEPARGLSWYAAYAYDRAPQERSRAASAAKAHVCDVFMRAARQMIEIHGGIGYTWGFDAHIWLKRAQFDFACLGTPSRHRDRQARAAGWADGQTRAS